MQGQLPAPTASGSLAKTPFAHLLVYALERRLTGTFELSVGDASMATMVVLGGCPAKIRTAEPIHHLGIVLMELGMISPEQLQTSLARLQESPRLQGQILLEMGAVDPPRLEAGLRSQVERKVEHLFGLSNDTTFTYYDGLDFLQHFGGAPTPIDPFPVLWRGVRDRPAWEHVDVTLRRVGGAFIRPSATAQLERFAFTPQELEAIERLRQRPLRVVDIAGVIGPALGQVLVYFLMIMKQVDLIDAQAAVQPAQPPPSPASAARLQAANVPAPSSNGQAFARVHLQRQAARPLIVEEQIAPSSAHDGRASSPGMLAPQGAFAAQPAKGAFGPPIPSSAPPLEPVVDAAEAPTGFNVGSMISQTIQSSSVPPPIQASATSVPAPAAVTQAIAPPPPLAATDGTEQVSLIPPALTAEQDALKAKILERAEQINSQDYFQMLGVERDATNETVQKAFIALAKVWHPDRLPPALADVKDACSKVFTHLTEAHATLTDAAKRQGYMTLLRDGGATPDDQAKIQAILEAATEFQKAEFLLKRNLNDPQAYEIVKRCVSLDDEQADYLATLAWLEAQRPEWQSREKTLEKVLVLDRCIQQHPNSERAFFYRAMLYKRAEVPNKALRDFKRAAELNPRNLDAMREVRIHNMRAGASKPPPGVAGTADRSSKPPPAEKRGGLFGKLFKK
jgi:tetratricopeptide (TPR) repeat protein